MVLPDVNNVLSTFQRNDEKYSELFEKVEEGTTPLEFDEINPKKYEYILSTEFLLVRIQVLIKVEKNRIDSLLTFKDKLSPSIVSMLALRKNKLIEKEKNVEDLINSYKSTAYILYNSKQ